MSSTIKQDLEELLTCSICLDKLSEPKLLPCSHRFCLVCLHREIERSSTTGPNPSFPCPLCKRTVYLPRGRQGKERVDCFETDRLLKDVLERLGDEPADALDVCSYHRMRLEVVCYSCQKTGCVRCAWQTHRHCSRVELYENEVKRVERDLRYYLKIIETHIGKITAHIRMWTQVEKSLENQIQYSNRFVHRCLQNKREQFKSAYCHLTDAYDSYIRNKKVSLDETVELKNVMETSLAKLDIDAKCQEATKQLKERTCQCLESVRKASSQTDSVPDISQLTELLKTINRTLNLNRRDMVVQGELILDKNIKDVLSESFTNQIKTFTLVTPVSFQLDGLVTKEDQVHLGIEDEEELLEQLIKVTEAADDPKRLRDDMERLCFPHRSQERFEQIDDILSSDNISRLSQCQDVQMHQNVSQNTEDGEDPIIRNVGQSVFHRVEKVLYILIVACCIVSGACFTYRFRVFFVVIGSLLIALYFCLAIAHIIRKLFSIVLRVVKLLILIVSILVLLYCVVKEPVSILHCLGGVMFTEFLVSVFRGLREFDYRVHRNRNRRAIRYRYRH